MNRMAFRAGALVVLMAMSGAAAAKPGLLTATLSGAGETAGGDTDGTGAFRAEVDDDTGDFCFSLYADNIAAPTMAHVHEGAAGSDGKPVATIGVTGKGEDSCIAMEPELLKKILAAPAAYYINIHTADFPKGAVRGQLEKK